MNYIYLHSVEISRPNSVIADSEKLRINKNDFGYSFKCLYQQFTYTLYLTRNETHLALVLVKNIFLYFVFFFKIDITYAVQNL